MKFLRLPLLLACLFSLMPASGPAAAAQSATPAANAPAIVLILRHAEKPPAEKDPNLSPQGIQRAEALPALFLPRPGGPAPRFPRPDVLFASAPSKHSNRPIQTVTPLSHVLRLPINENFVDAATGAIAREVLSGRYAGKVVLICWHHEEIPNLAKALGVADPPKWKDSVFDRVWEITWKDGQAALTVAPQQLLPGDSSH